MLMLMLPLPHRLQVDWHCCPLLAATTALRMLLWLLWRIVTVASTARYME